MNVTSTGVFRSDSGAGPIWLNVTYPTGLAWNTTWIHTNINIDSGDLANAVVVGGVTASNLVDKSVIETIAAIWTFNDDISLATGKSIISSSGGTPDIVTFTYPATVSWNGTWAHNFNSASVTNVGAAGNDFGATNTLVASTFSGDITLSANLIKRDDTNDFLNIYGGDGTAGSGGLIQVRGKTAGTPGSLRFFTPNAAGTADINRLTCTGVVATSTCTWAAVIIDFDAQSVLNVGAAGNDFGATNTLVATTFSGIVDGGGFGFNNLGAAGNDFGATNTLVATSMSGAVDFNNNNLVDVANIASDTNNAIVLQGNHDNGNSLVFNAARLAASAGQCIEIATNNNVDAMTTRFIVNCGTATVSGTWSAITHSGFTLGAVMKVSGNNTIPIFEDAVRPSNLYTVIITSKSQTTGDINFEGGNLDWTFIETGILGDNYKGLVLIDKPTIIDGVYVFPETYRRVFEVNEDGIFHLGNKLAEDRRVSDLENRIQDLENILELRN